MSTMRETTKRGALPSSPLEGSKDMDISRESTKSEMDTWGSGAGCDGRMDQIADFEDLDSQRKGTSQAWRESVQQNERVHSHATASTSLRCEFQWVYEILDHEYQEWLLEMGYTKNFPSMSFFSKLKLIPSS